MNSKISKERLQELKRKSIALDPIVRVGKSGMTKTVIDQVRKALMKRKLIKVKLLKSFLENSDKKKAAQELADATGAEVISRVGFSVTLYKR